MVTWVGFAGLVALVALQRLIELRVSRRHEAGLRARGARETAPRQLVWMKLVHGGWIVGMCLEVFALERPLYPALAIAALAVFALGQWLRLAAMRALGDRWTVRILTVPDEQVVTSGVFRLVRHPNYLGVALEIAALPLIHTAWITALVFTVLNALVLWRRIRAEEHALTRDSDYAEAFG
jgi:methyltransferase